MCVGWAAAGDVAVPQGELAYPCEGPAAVGGLEGWRGGRGEGAGRRTQSCRLMGAGGRSTGASSCCERALPGQRRRPPAFAQQQNQQFCARPTCYRVTRLRSLEGGPCGQPAVTGQDGQGGSTSGSSNGCAAGLLRARRWRSHPQQLLAPLEALCGPVLLGVGGGGGGAADGLVPRRLELALRRKTIDHARADRHTLSLCLWRGLADRACLSGLVSQR